MNFDIHDPSGPFLNLEKNSIRLDDPFSIKTIFLPMQKFHILRFNE